MRAEFHFCLRSKQLSREFRQCSFQVGKCDIFINHQSFDLMEGRGMCRVHLVRTEYSTRGKHTDRQFPFFHHADLYRRGLGTKHDIACDIKSILFILGGMIRRYIQSVSYTHLDVYKRQLLCIASTIYTESEDCLDIFANEASKKLLAINNKIKV